MTSTKHPELLGTLTDGIARLTTSEEWQRYLDLQSRFHRYSFGNVLLIAAQRREATQVAGFKAWRRLNRQVCRGERAIFILAPVRYRRAADPDPDGDQRDREARMVCGFRWVPVFDIAQTEGDPLVAVSTGLVGGDPDGHYQRLQTAAGALQFVVEDHHFAGGTNGDCCHRRRRIRVESANAPAQRVKTLAHELAHALLHETFDNRAQAELEAESTAYVVCRHLGIDSGAYSFGYVAGWAGGGSEAVGAIRAAGERIQKTAATIVELAALDAPGAVGNDTSGPDPTGVDPQPDGC